MTTHTYLDHPHDYTWLELGICVVPYMSLKQETSTHNQQFSGPVTMVIKYCTLKSNQHYYFVQDKCYIISITSWQQSPGKSIAELNDEELLSLQMKKPKQTLCLQTKSGSFCNNTINMQNNKYLLNVNLMSQLYII